MKKEKNLPKFKYKMQNILNLKYKLEEQQKLNLASVRLRLQEEEESLNRLYQRKEEYEKALRKASKKLIKVDVLKILNESIMVLDYHIKEQKKEVLRAESIVKLEEDKMVEAMKERKIQEKLRKKSLQRYLEEMRHKENIQVDELVSYQYTVRKEEVGGGEKNGRV